MPISREQALDEFRGRIVEARAKYMEDCPDSNLNVASNIVAEFAMQMGKQIAHTSVINMHDMPMIQRTLDRANAMVMVALEAELKIGRPQ